MWRFSAMVGSAVATSVASVVAKNSAAAPLVKGRA